MQTHPKGYFFTCPWMKYWWGARWGRLYDLFVLLLITTYLLATSNYKIVLFQ